MDGSSVVSVLHKRMHTISPGQLREWHAWAWTCMCASGRAQGSPLVDSTAIAGLCHQCLRKVDCHQTGSSCAWMLRRALSALLASTGTSVLRSASVGSGTTASGSGAVSPPCSRTKSCIRSTNAAFPLHPCTKHAVGHAYSIELSGCASATVRA